MEHNLPTPPREDHVKSHSSKKGSSSSKTVKSVHRSSKRSSTSHSHPQPAAPTHHHDSHSHSMADGRHKRVWKACERCRMKKTKCDGEFPCKRCKDDGLVCTAGTRKKTEYKQLPRGYAEVLENTQFALIATVHKLYAMVRSGQQWDLGEPDLNDRGQPVIHNIASKLGCIRPNSDMDLPVHSVFPEDEAGLAELAAQLEAQQREIDTHPGVKAETDSSCNRTDRASSSELDHSDFEQDYRKAAFGGGNTVTLSPQSLSYDSFDGYSAPSESLATQSPTVPTSYAPWTAPRQAPTMNFGPQQYFQQPNSYMDMDMLNQGLMESEFGTIKPHMLSCPNPEVMMGVGDPMIYSGYDGEQLRL